MESVDKLFVDLNPLTSRGYFQVHEVTRLLKLIKPIIAYEGFGKVINDHHWSTLHKILSEACNILEGFIKSDELDFICELFRCLRNICAGCEKNQEYISSHGGFFDKCSRILLHITTLHNGNSKIKENAVLQCCLQFFGNLCQYTLCKKLVWNYFISNDIFQCLLPSSNPTVQEYTMMVLYNCMTKEDMKFFIDSCTGNDLLILLTECLCQNLVDWGMFIIEVLVEKEEFLPKCYNTLPISSRLLILDVITEILEQTSECQLFRVPFIAVKHIADLFVTDAMDIVKLCSLDIPDLKPMEICKLLSLLCAASSHDEYSIVLKDHQELTEASIDVLKSVHLLGKTEFNSFSSLSNLKVTEKAVKEEVEQNPSFGFKKNVIRLIGNLSLKSKANQDLIRKLDGIPLLLDCCNIDARNPYIMQWCILGIRNLLEHNQENQEVLAKISITGELMGSTLLQELNLEVHMQDGKPMLRQSINSS